jgi:methylenetetrahydrofolate dehydrogenase (NADP+) / methenyltetrahydrofolate cyclohydrolase
MTAKILSAQPLVEKIKKDLQIRCGYLKNQGIQPTMSVVLVGSNPASLSYIRNKKRLCEEIGASFQLLQLPMDISEKEFLDHLNRLNHDSSIHGIIIQLPVSEHLKRLDLPNLILAHKDIDGFHGKNTQAIYAGTTNLRLLLPCTPKGIINLLKFYGVEMAGKHVVVLGRSLIVGKPLAMLLSNFDATVSLAHSKTTKLENLTKNADIIIAAIGKTHFLKKTHLNPEKKSIVIDVGMNTLNGKLTGDVDPEVAEIAGGLSPVPGGVGPMTVVSLIENLITATENQMKG